VGDLRQSYLLLFVYRSLIIAIFTGFGLVFLLQNVKQRGYGDWAMVANLLDL
jgi:hypothetical protein